MLSGCTPEYRVNRMIKNNFESKVAKIYIDNWGTMDGFTKDTSRELIDIVQTSLDDFAKTTLEYIDEDKEIQKLIAKFEETQISNNNANGFTYTDVLNAITSSGKQVFNVIPEGPIYFAGADDFKPISKNEMSIIVTDGRSADLSDIIRELSSVNETVFTYVFKSPYTGTISEIDFSDNHVEAYFFVILIGSREKVMEFDDAFKTYAGVDNISILYEGYVSRLEVADSPKALNKDDSSMGNLYLLITDEAGNDFHDMAAYRVRNKQIEDNYNELERFSFTEPEFINENPMTVCEIEKYISPYKFQKVSGVNINIESVNNQIHIEINPNDLEEELYRITYRTGNADTGKEIKEFIERQRNYDLEVEAVLYKDVERKIVDEIKELCNERKECITKGGYRDTRRKNLYKQASISLLEIFKECFYENNIKSQGILPSPEIYNAINSTFDIPNGSISDEAGKFSFYIMKGVA
jgi:hypothetical protein